MEELVGICCLKGIGDGTKKHRLIQLDGSNEVTIGRDMHVTVFIPSPVISRRHAILQKQSDGTWTITDNKSLNGVKVNDAKLLPLQPCALRDGDSVQVGVPQAPEDPAYMWTFHTRLQVKRKAASDRKRQCIIANKKPCPSGWTPTRDLERKLAEEEGRRKEEEEEEGRRKEEIREQEERLEEMRQRLEEKDVMHAAMETELRGKEEALREEMMRQKEQMEVERCEFKAEMKRAYEAELEAKEHSLLERLDREQEQLREEKRTVEETLQKEMERVLDEKNIHLKVELEKQKAQLDSVIAQRELEHKMLSSELTKTRTENAVQIDAALQARESLLANFATLMETELQCSICNELFVQATSLNCSHSFCAACIDQWMKVKRQCPVCRTPVTSHLRSLVLDSYIDRMVEHLSDDMRKSRDQLIAERKAEKLTREANALTALMTTSRGRGGRRRGRGRARGGRSTRGRVVTAAPLPQITTPAALPQITTPAVPPVPIVIESDASDADSASGSSDDFHRYSNTSDDSAEDSVEGVPGTYYGGWGHCFHCGSRGHWANGCPYTQ